MLATVWRKSSVVACVDPGEQEPRGHDVTAVGLGEVVRGQVTVVGAREEREVVELEPRAVDRPGAERELGDDEEEAEQDDAVAQRARACSRRTDRGRGASHPRMMS
jgi:hypothetical protein